MKPSSLATIILRFIGIYLFVSGILTGIGSAVFSSVFQQPTSATLGGSFIQMNTPFAGLVGIQLGIAVACVISGILLYIWSYYLGRFIAKGLE